MKRLRASLIALAAILIALTAVFTLVIRIPITATGGYFNFSDVVIYFSSFTFGPWVGLIAGGIGTGLADPLGGFAAFAPLSFLAHGLEGLAAGAIGQKGTPGRLILGLLAGTALMVGIYLLGEGLFYGIGWGAALAEVPWNLLQNLVGGLVGIPLFYAVRKAYPPVTRIGRPSEWREG
jgi:energy-coupling factor transport system substrate-specific component